MGHLLHTYLCTTVFGMDKEKDWFSSMADRKITVVEIAKHLEVSRNTARSRLDEGLTSDEIIQLARALHLNPVTALNELGKLEGQEIFDFLDSDGTLLATASPQQLIYQLAQDSLGHEEKGRLWKEVSDPVVIAMTWPLVVRVPPCRTRLLHYQMTMTALSVNLTTPRRVRRRFITQRAGRTRETR